MLDQNKTVDLLWTGGWDSAFQLMRLTLDCGFRVRPWYIIDENRRSVPFEIKAMERIREMISAKHPRAANQPGFFYLKPFVRIGENGVYRINQEYIGSSEYVLFKYFFSFPLLDTTKRQMLETACGKGWEEEINLTWFCLNPGGAGS